MTHFMVKSYVPVFNRLVETYASGAQWMQKDKVLVPKYKRWSYNYWTISKTSIPKKVWSINRIRVKRTGQLALWQ